MKWINNNWFKIAIVILLVWLIITLQDFKFQIDVCVMENPGLSKYFKCY